MIVVGPVTNGTGRSFPFDVTDSLRHWLTDQLQYHHFSVVSPEKAGALSERALLVSSTLLFFKSGALAPQLNTGMGTSQCSLSTELGDFETRARLGSIVASELTEQDPPLTLLLTCARMTADELSRRINH